MINRRTVIAIILFIIAGLIIFTFANPLGGGETDDNPTQQEILEDAEAAVERAEASLLQADVDYARGLVDDLDDGPDKDDLNDRLDAVQALIDAEEAVEEAESSKSQEDVDAARDLVDDLPEGTKKDELNNRLDDVQEEIDAANALAEATAAVEKAEDTETQEDVDAARDLVDDLPEGDDKDDLNDRLDAVQAIIDGRTPPVRADTTRPVIALIGDASVTVEVGSVYTDLGATATDNVDGTITGDIVRTGSVDTSTLGTYYYYFNVSDAAGNDAIQRVRTIRVVDTTIPVITLIGDATVEVEVNTSYTDLGATATDNYDGDITSDITRTGTVDVTTLGTYYHYFNVSDSSGNDAVEVIRTFEVVDTTKPRITGFSVPWNYEKFEVDSAALPYVDTADVYTSDNSGLPVSVTRRGCNVDLTTVGSYKCQYYIEDTSGNFAYYDRFIRVVEANPEPIIFFDKNDGTETDIGSAWETIEARNEIYTDWVYAKSYDEFDDDTYYAGSDLSCSTDPNCSYEIYYRFDAGSAESPVSEIDLGITGLYRVVYRIHDNTGNSRYRYRWVTVVDTIPPRVGTSARFPNRLEEGMPEPMWGLYARYADNSSHPLHLFVRDDVDMGVPGMYKVRYRVEETHTTGDSPYGGNRTPLVTIHDENVEVVEATPEQISFTTGWTPIFERDETASEFPDAGNIGTAWDEWDQTHIPAVFVNCKEGDSHGSIVTQAYAMDNPGVYWCSYKATDSTGHTRWNGREVTVVPDMPEQIRFTTGWTPHFDMNPGARELPDASNIGYAWDEYDQADIPAVFVSCREGHSRGPLVTQAYVMANPGVYWCNYKATDSTGHTRWNGREVTIDYVDLEAPVIVLDDPNPYYMLVGETYSEPGYTATDNIDGDITGDVVVSGSVNNMVAGTYTLYYDVEDSNHNSAVQQERTVHVALDRVPPVITLNPLIPPIIMQGTPWVDPGYTATDNIDGDITGDVVISGWDGNTSSIGPRTIYYDVVDSSGNTAVQRSREVLIVPNIIPLDRNNPDISFDIRYTGGSDNLRGFSITVTDNETPFDTGVDPSSLRWVLIPAGDPQPSQSYMFTHGIPFNSGDVILRGDIQPALSGNDWYKVCVYAEDMANNYEIDCSTKTFK